MLKLILHHTYRLDGLAVDLSHHHNHGVPSAVTFLEDGREPGGGALGFETDDSSVHVPWGPVWSELGAVRIDAWLRLAEHGHRQTVAVGHNAFSMSIEPDGVLRGMFTPPPAPGGPPPPSLVVDSARGAPDGVRRTVPLDAWTRLTYEHDGFATLRLSIDGVPAASAYDIRHPVGPVGPAGVTFGHGLAAGSTLRGALDEVKVWKYDPQSSDRQFFDRPFDDGLRDCWREVQADWRQQLAEPGQAALLESLLRCVWGVYLDGVRRLRAGGEAALAEERELSAAYRALWASGDIAGDAMREHLTQWFAWLASRLGPGEIEAFLDRLRGCLAQYEGQLDLPDLGEPLAACDPALADYIERASEAAAGAGLPGLVLPESEEPGKGPGQGPDQGPEQGPGQGPDQGPEQESEGKPDDGPAQGSGPAAL